jgi:WS/DGAT/MGAT family acyltransferase
VVVIVMALDRLTADDRLVLWTDAVWPQDVGVLAILEGGPLLEPDGRFRLEAARRAVAARLHLMPRMRQVLRVPRRGLGGPLWVDDPSFELDAHVRQAPVRSPGGEVELLRSVESLRRTRLDPSRPLWQMWFLPGPAGGRIGWFMRLHHVVADGIAGVASLAALLDAAPNASADWPRPWAPRHPPSTGHLLLDEGQRRVGTGAAALSTLAHPGDFVRGLSEAWPATRELLFGAPGPSTSLDGLVGPSRKLVVARSSLSKVSAVAHAEGATVNDVLLAMIAGGIRSLLTSRGEPIEGLSVPAYVPMSLRRGEGGIGVGNRISQLIVPLPIGVADPHERLRRISAEMARLKAVPRLPLGKTFGSRLLSRPMLKLVIRQRVNVSSADLIGPSSTRYFAGAEVLDLFPLLNLMGNVTLGVGALSYAGRFELLAIGDDQLHPDLDVLVLAASEEVEALVAAMA